MIDVLGNIDRKTVVSTKEWYEGLYARLEGEMPVKELWVLQTSHHTGEVCTAAEIAVEPEYKNDAYKAFLIPPGDGLITAKQEVLERNAAIVAITADCPTVFLEHSESGRIALLHCSRDALYRNEEEGKYSVIDNAMEHFREDGASGVTVHSYCGIQSHFFHEKNHPLYKERDGVKIEAFREDCKSLGLPAIRGSEEENDLNLQNIITCQFVSHSVPTQNITHDSIDTYADTNYASNRRDGEKRTKSNVVVYLPSAA